MPCVDEIEVNRRQQHDVLHACGSSGHSLEDEPHRDMSCMRAEAHASLLTRLQVYACERRRTKGQADTALTRRRKKLSRTLSKQEDRGTSRLQHHIRQPKRQNTPFQHPREASRSSTQTTTKTEAHRCCTLTEGPSQATSHAHPRASLRTRISSTHRETRVITHPVNHESTRPERTASGSAASGAACLSIMQTPYKR